MLEIQFINYFDTDILVDDWFIWLNEHKVFYSISCPLIISMNSIETTIQVKSAQYTALYMYYILYVCELKPSRIEFI